jgi:hypothetical protein
VGAIHGRLLTAWSAAGVAGPLIVNRFLDSAGGAGTLDASAYRPALFTMVAVLAVGFIANLLVRPVAAKFHEDMTQHAPEKEADEVASEDADEAAEGGSETIRLVLAWAVVGILLAYGVFQTLTTALKLVS